MKPIIGACFVCADCPHFSLCQNCYFTTPFQTIKVRGHSAEKHRIEVIVEPRQTVKKVVKCNGCGDMPIQNVRYKCDNCFDFDFCETCFYLYCKQKKELKTVYSTSHKNYHTFTKIMLPPANLQGPSNLEEPHEEDSLEEILKPGKKKPGRPPSIKGAPQTKRQSLS